MGATHLPSIVISIALAAVPAQAQGFSSVLLIVPLAANSLNGERYVVYTSSSAAVADESAGYISSSTLLAVQVAFSQNPAPATFTVGNVDIAGAETYPEALQACLDAGAAVYGVCIESRADADVLAMAADVEARSMLYCAVSADADWLTSGFPAALTALEGREQTFGIYHDASVATAWPDVVALAGRLAFNPDTKSVAWNHDMAAVPQLTTAITDAQRLLLKANNMNVGLPFASATDNYLYQGVNFAGRQISEIVTKDWFEQRLQEATSALIARLSALGDKLPLSIDGQARIIGLVEALYAQGDEAGHFAEGQHTIAGLTITAADLSLYRLRFQGTAQLLASATDIEFNFDFSTSPLA